MVFAVGCGARSAKEGHLVDALAPRGDEGRGTLRKARGRGERSLIPGSPNGATHRASGIFISIHRVERRTQRTETSHVAGGKDINRDSASSGERKRIRPVAWSLVPEPSGKAGRSG